MKETIFEKQLAEIKGELKEMLREDSSKEDIDRIAELDKRLDELKCEHQKVVDESTELKGMVINQVKSTGFKVEKQEDDIGVSETKSLDDILLENARNIEQSRKH